MSKKAPPAELETLDGPATAVAEVETIAPPAPKMEMAQMPADVVKPPAVAPTMPGTFAPAPVFTLPPVEVKHYLEVFKHMAPVEAGPQAPGVWLNPDGSVYTPRQREGGQFSVMRVEFANAFRPEMGRVDVFPLATPPDEYGAAKNERIVSRTEVKFDFQDQMLDCLEAFKKKPDPLADHLRNRLREQGVPSGQGFDVPLRYSSGR